MLKLAKSAFYNKNNHSKTCIFDNFCVDLYYKNKTLTLKRNER